MTKEQVVSVINKNNELRKKIRNTHRIYKLIILALLITICIQSYYMNNLKTHKEPIRILSTGELEQISDNTFQIKDNRKDIAQFTEIQLPPMTQISD